MRIGTFDVKDLFEGLKGTIRPTIDQEAVSLVLDSPPGIGTLQTDEGKVAQILRNFLTNAVKYTERGQICLTARPGPEDVVVFSVSDTGIGIAPGDLSRIFEDFGQLENPLQKRMKGTGLGLPLTRKLATLLGGSVSVRSQEGAGSTFYAVIPRYFRAIEVDDPAPGFAGRLTRRAPPCSSSMTIPPPSRSTTNISKDSSYQNIRVRTLADARTALRDFRPIAVILSTAVEDNRGKSLLREIKSSDWSRGIPVLAVTSSDDARTGADSGADLAHSAPVPRQWLLEKLRDFEATKSVETVLIVDDHEPDRYLIKESLLALGQFEVIEAETGQEAFTRLRSVRPDVIFLDLFLPDMTGFEILDQLKSDYETRSIPVVINTSRVLEQDERDRLFAQAVEILAKGSGSREEAIAQVRGSLVKAGLSR